jgi:hypothetical protein
MGLIENEEDKCYIPQIKHKKFISNIYSILNYFKEIKVI